MQLFLKMQFNVAQKCVDFFFQNLGTSSQSVMKNGVKGYEMILDLPIHGIICPVGASKMILEFPYEKIGEKNDVKIYDMSDQIIKNGKFSDAGEINTFLSENFSRTDAPPPPSMNSSTREKLIKINGLLDEILKNN
jgi:hypothetical protein